MGPGTQLEVGSSRLGWFFEIGRVPAGRQIPIWDPAIAKLVVYVRGGCIGVEHLGVPPRTPHPALHIGYSDEALYGTSKCLAPLAELWLETHGLAFSPSYKGVPPTLLPCPKPSPP